MVRVKTNLLTFVNAVLMTACVVATSTVGDAATVAATPVTSPAPSASTVATSLNEQLVQYLESRVAKGDVRAETCLGDMYRTGTGVPGNYQRAIDLFQKAANQGDAWGQVLLAEAIVQQGTDPQRLIFLRMEIEKLADSGDAHAETFVGSLNLYGSLSFDVPINDSEALHWLNKAAAQDDPTAEAMLAGIYRYGRGVPVNLKRAEIWLRKGASHKFDCLADFASQTYALINNNVDYPASVLSGAESGRVILGLAFNSEESKPNIQKSSGYPNLDRAALVAASDLPLPTWNGARKGSTFLMPVDFSRMQVNYSLWKAVIKYGIVLHRAVYKSDAHVWSEDLHHTRDNAIAKIAFDCVKRKTTQITIASPSGDVQLDNNSMKAVEAVSCPPVPLRFVGEIPAHFSLAIGDPWDGSNFDDPADTPRTPYGIQVRNSVRKALVLPKHALIYGTTGTGITEVAFDIRLGKAMHAVVIRSSGDPEVDRAALEAVMNAHLPEISRGEMEASHITMHVNFPLGSSIQIPATSATPKAGTATRTPASTSSAVARPP